MRLSGLKHGPPVACHDGMKTVVNKVKRSGVYYLMTTVASTDETKNARFDTWGTLAVVLLLLGVVGLVRFVLTV
jgi:hypothetical protein